MAKQTKHEQQQNHTKYTNAKIHTDQTSTTLKYLQKEHTQKMVLQCIKVTF